MSIRTGLEYRASLRDGRTIYVNGTSVADVTSYAPFGGIVDTIASLYDLQHSAPELLTYPSPKTGELVSCSFLQPRNRAEIEQRAKAEEYRAEASYGLLGRLPDNVNALITGAAANHEFFGQRDARFGQNVLRYYEEVREHDWCLTHTLVDPQVDRSKGAATQADPSLVLHLVRETDAGIIVSGARMLSTLAPFSNEIWVGPSYPRMPGEEAHALCFAVPVATRGLKFLCREPYGANDDRFDRPLSSRFDEADALAIFDEVLVPWDRVFILGDIEIYNAAFARAVIFSMLQGVVRATVKLRFLSGLAVYIAETIGRAEQPEYQSMLGELIGYAELANGIVRAGIEELGDFVEGKPKPPTALPSAMYVLMPHAHVRATEIIRRISGSGLIMTPTAKDFANTEIAQYVERYLQGKGVPARRRVQLFKLAWDLIGEAFGGRQLQYEMFYGGDSMVMRRMFCQLPSVQGYKAMVDKLLKSDPPRSPAHTAPSRTQELVAEAGE